MNDIKQRNTLLSVAPVEEYTPPSYPTYTDAYDNPAMLKKLPSRWQKNTAVITCIGLMGVAALTGCDNLNNRDSLRYGYEECVEYDGYIRYDRRDELSLRVHWGGEGFGPFYVVYLTEQEALNIIRAEAAVACLRFNDTPPTYTATVYIGPASYFFGLDLFNNRNNIAISFVNMDDNLVWDWWERRGQDFAELIASEFSNQTNNLSIGVIYSPGTRVDSDQPDDETKEEARQILREHIAAQVRDFIEELRAQEAIR